MSVTAAIEALRHDSDVWDRVSGVLRGASQDAGGLALGAAELSWASLSCGLDDTYAQLQQKVVMLLSEGAEMLGDLTIALDEVATAYELSDETAAARFKGVWDVRE